MDDRLRRCPVSRPGTALQRSGLLRLQQRLQPALRVVHVLREGRVADVLHAVGVVHALQLRLRWQQQRQALHPEARAVHVRVLRVRHEACGLHVGRVVLALHEVDAVRALREGLEPQPAFLRVGCALRVVHEQHVLHVEHALRAAYALRHGDRCGYGFAGGRCDALRCAQGAQGLPVSRQLPEQQALPWRRTDLPAT